MPEGAHPLGEIQVMEQQYERSQRKGWGGMPFAELDGKTWTLDIASRLLDVPVAVLRAAVKYVGAEPVGTLRMRAHRGSGRQPLGYRAADLISISEGLRAVREEINSRRAVDEV